MIQLKNKTTIILFLSLFLFLSFFGTREANAAVEILRPNGVGSETSLDWYWPLSGEHWDHVDEIIPDDIDAVGTNYGSYSRDLYNISDHSIGNGAIQKITIFFRCGGKAISSAFGVNYFKSSLKTNGTIYDGAEISTNAKIFTDLSQDWTENPATNRPWTWIDIDALEIGISAKLGQAGALCSQVYVEVEYTVITLLIGENKTISVSCSDSDYNLYQCNVISPCSKTCSASGGSGACSCVFTCATEGSFNTCGQAVDSQSLTDTLCSNTIACIANHPPETPSSLNDKWENCVYDGRSIPILSWSEFDDDDEGDTQIAYEIRISTNSSVQKELCGENDFCEVATGTANAYTPTDRLEDWSDWMLWNQNYWWAVRVKDNHDKWSDWEVKKFDEKTPIEPYPYPGFDWLPEDPNQKEVVVFNPDANATDVYYSWTFNQGALDTYEPTDGTSETSEEPHIKFLISTNTVKLKVTDKQYSNYFCESKPAEGTLLNAQLPLPEYHEVAPIIWFKSLFFALASIIDGFVGTLNKS